MGYIVYITLDPTFKNNLRYYLIKMFKKLLHYKSQMYLIHLYTAYLFQFSELIASFYDFIISKLELVTNNL